MQILHSSFYGDPNIGLYAKACDKFCLVGSFVSDKDIKSIKEYLKVTVKKCLIANTDFTGLFSVANSNGILLSKVVTEREIEMFERIAKEFGINLAVLDSKFSAVGNLILCNDKGAAVSELFRKSDIDKMKDCFDVEIAKVKVANTDIVGSCGVATNKGCLLHRDASEEEIKSIGEILKVNADIGTANFGSPFVGSCIISNSSGALMGDRTTPPEMDRLMQTLNLD
ncbi:MAG: translation initiation factor IF-6 [Candidatus Aenigmarchaeota archaeon]|nr:translation initiation factor IF-6 [Candidatus Aenigmarchaeota archaeon]